MPEKEILTTRPGCIPTLCDPMEPDPILDLYRKDVDRTLLRENLKLSSEERLAKLISAADAIASLRRENGLPAL